MEDYTLSIDHSLNALNGCYRYVLYDDHNSDETDYEVRTSSKEVIKMNINPRGLKITGKTRLNDYMIDVHYTNN